MSLFGFILRATMVLRLKVWISQVLLLALASLVCWPADIPVALAQKTPKATGREPEKPALTRGSRPKRPTAPAVSKSPASDESGNFLKLGNGFREQKKWKAAEAAYKEAVKAWPGNVEALLELGFLYLDRNRLDEAQQTYSDLRSRNASFASHLLAEINKYKAKLAH